MLVAADEQPIRGNILDVSVSGISVECTSALPPGKSVVVDCGGMAADAKVVHCLPSGDGFRIGLSLETVNGEE
jgi:PilZ domain